MPESSLYFNIIHVVFGESLGTIHQFSGMKPVFCKPRAVLFALKEAVSKELNRLEEQGILRRVNYSEWAAPVVPVAKADGRLRLCGDYKVTINPYLEVDQYPLDISKSSGPDGISAHMLKHTAASTAPSI